MSSDGPFRRIWWNPAVILVLRYTMISKWIVLAYCAYWLIYRIENEKNINCTYQVECVSGHNML